MAVSPDAQLFADYVVELTQGIGPVRGKRMFGGVGLFLEDLMFGLIAGNTLYLKADDENRPDFIARDLQPFTYQKQGKDFSLSYYQAPEEALEELEVMTQWASAAYGAALRAARNKAGKSKAPRNSMQVAAKQIKSKQVNSKQVKSKQRKSKQRKLKQDKS